MKFLLVDDNNYCSKYLRELISDNGDTCIVVKKNEDIYSTSMTYKPDWLLINIQMMGKNSFKIIEEIKNEMPKVPVAVLSDFYDERLRLNAEKVGASAFIAKENLFDFYSILNSVITKEKEKQ